MADIRNYFEISEAPSPDGRRRIKLALHEIYQDESQWNLNGITYLEEYTRKNAGSIVGMPLCATFLDEDKEIPYDHGMTGNDGAMPLFEDSEQVGTADGWEIADITIDEEIKKVCLATGYINQQRYPNFVKWLETQRSLNIPVFGSVEFVGTKENQEIIYRDGWKEEGRIPTDYVYSGFCILSVKPSDSSAIMVEFNQLNKINKNNKKGDLDKMDEKQIEQLIVSVKTAISETNSKNEEFNTKISELNEEVSSKEVEIESLNKKITEMSSVVEGKDAELAELNTLIDQMKNELNVCKKDMAINELNQSLKTFTEDEKAYAKEDIDLFNEDYTKVEVNSIITKINAGIGAKTKELQIAEINSVNNNKPDDIFGYVDETSKEDLVDIDNIFV